MTETEERIDCEVFSAQPISLTHRGKGYEYDHANADLTKPWLSRDWCGILVTCDIQFHGDKTFSTLFDCSMHGRRVSLACVAFRRPFFGCAERQDFWTDLDLPVVRLLDSHTAALEYILAIRCTILDSSTLFDDGDGRLRILTDGNIRTAMSVQCMCVGCSSVPGCYC